MPTVAPTPRRPRRETSINLRVSTRLLDLITTAAGMSGKSRTEFMLESARRDAIDVLLDRRIFELDADGFDAVLGVLDDPAPPNETLRRLLARKAPWEVPWEA